MAYCPKEGAVVLPHLAEGAVVLTTIGCLFVEGARLSAWHIGYHAWLPSTTSQFDSLLDPHKRVGLVAL